MKKVKKSRLFCSSGFILIEISGFQMVATVVTPWFFGTMDLSVSTACVLCRSGLEDDHYFGARQWSRRKLTCSRKRDHFRRKLHYSNINFQDMLVFLTGNESPFYSYAWFWCGFIPSFPTKDQPDIGSELTISRQYEVWHIENCWNNLHWNSTDDTPDLERRTFEDPIAWFERLYLYSLVSELCLFQLLNFLARDDRGGKDCWTPKKIYRRWGFACFG